MFDKEMTIVVLNALLDECGNFVSSIYGKKEATPFSELWSFYKIEETRLKAKSDVGSNEKVKAYDAMTKRKGKFRMFDPRKKKKIDMSKIQYYECNAYGHFKRNCLNSRRTTRRERKEVKPMLLKKWKNLKR